MQLKKFTVKDFIEYNNPCISCDRNISFNIGTLSPNSNSTSMKRPTVKKDMTEVDLKVSYDKTLTLWIYHITNKFRASDSQFFEKYLEENSLFLSSQCNCGTGMQSFNLDFNLDKSFIKPVGISSEIIILNDEDSFYQIYSSFTDNKTKVVAIKRDRAIPANLELPLTPRYKLRNKEHLLTKLKTYLIFS